MPYLPTSLISPDWFTMPCPTCGATLRSSKSELLRKTLNRHKNDKHRDMPPDPPHPDVKQIRVITTYGDDRRPCPGPQTVTVPWRYPGERGIVFVTNGEMKVYPTLRARETGWEVV
jgi:hypothetical protein